MCSEAFGVLTCSYTIENFFEKNVQRLKKVNLEIAPEQLKRGTTPQGCERPPGLCRSGTVRLIVSITRLLPIKVGKFAF